MISWLSRILGLKRKSAAPSSIVTPYEEVCKRLGVKPNFTPTVVKPGKPAPLPRQGHHDNIGLLNASQVCLISSHDREIS